MDGEFTSDVSNAVSVNDKAPQTLKCSVSPPNDDTFLPSLSYCGWLSLSVLIHFLYGFRENSPEWFDSPDYEIGRSLVLLVPMGLLGAYMAIAADSVTRRITVVTILLFGHGLACYIGILVGQLLGGANSYEWTVLHTCLLVSSDTLLLSTNAALWAIQRKVFEGVLHKANSSLNGPKLSIRDMFATTTWCALTIFAARVYSASYAETLDVQSPDSPVFSHALGQCMTYAVGSFLFALFIGIPAGIAVLKSSRPVESTATLILVGNGFMLFIGVLAASGYRSFSADQFFVPIIGYNLANLSIVLPCMVLRLAGYRLGFLTTKQWGT